VPVLSLDTATARTTVAVVSSSGDVLAEASHLDARRHAEVLPRLVREVLTAAGTTPAQLDLIAVGVGPGPFTGLRVGVTFARATAHALGIPAVGAMTLDVIARGQSGRDPGPFTVVTRSRRVEVAWAAYDDALRGEIHRVEGPLILPNPGYPRRGRVIGDVDGVDELALPAAADLARLVLERVEAGETLPGDRHWPEDASGGSGAPTASLLAALASEGRWLLPALPLYLRRPDAVPA
jgi:tRNA threonylcarbamoyladenosine biosynthesis protein TsaB